MNGNEEKTSLKFIIRDFETSNLKKLEDSLKKFAEETIAKFPGSKLEFEVIEQYRNMKEILDDHPQVYEICI